MFKCMHNVCTTHTQTHTYQKEKKKNHIMHVPTVFSSYLIKDMLLFTKNGSIKENLRHAQVQNLVSNSNTNPVLGLKYQLSCQESK